MNAEQMPSMHVFKWFSKACVFFKLRSLTPNFTKIILQISYDFFLFITERFSFQIFIADELKKMGKISRQIWDI